METCENDAENDNQGGHIRPCFCLKLICIETQIIAKFQIEQDEAAADYCEFLKQQRLLEEAREKEEKAIEELEESVRRAKNNKAYAEKGYLLAVEAWGEEVTSRVTKSAGTSYQTLVGQMDHHLRAFREFARIYVDDVVASRTFDEHYSHLHQVFAKMEEMNIGLSPSKSFMGFPSVQLLGRHVDALGMTSVDEKVKANYCGLGCGIDRSVMTLRAAPINPP
ncbi:hypothetical protein DTO271G3_8095 [Paecilomyces variotii]|nr:hypothetical protein DTO271G3_8095 [Paecilomyces variotii]